MAKRFIQRQEERNKKRGRRSQLQGLPLHQSYKGTLIDDVADTVMGRASNLPAVKPPKSSRPKRVVPRDHRAGKAGNSIGPSYGFGRRSNVAPGGGIMRSTRSATRAMDRLSKGRSRKR